MVINMQKTKAFQLNIGSSSILLIFVVLSLIAFAVLTFVSANADSNLSQKVLHRTSSYYAACNEAEQSLHNIDQTLYDIYTTTHNADEYFLQAGGRILSFTYPITELQSLSIELEILYPDSLDGPFYRITKWKIFTTKSLDYDESLHVIFE